MGYGRRGLVEGGSSLPSQGYLGSGAAYASLFQVVPPVSSLPMTLAPADS